MSDLLLDTHALLWYLLEPSRLSVKASAAISATLAAGNVIRVSTVSVIEIVYLIEKGKLPAAALPPVLAAIHDAGVAIFSLAVTQEVAEATQRIPRGIVPDLPDRIIASTGLVHGLPVVTADRKIQAAPIPTIW